MTHYTLEDTHAGKVPGILIYAVKRNGVYIDESNPGIEFSFKLTFNRPMQYFEYGLFQFVPSDIRLKENIRYLETKNGLRLYSFNYLNESEEFVGVMAQDLMNTKYEDAAILRSDGYYNVNYSKLGIEMMRLADYSAVI
jgi:hypothetical protein